jgi:hypothetical protein
MDNKVSMTVKIEESRAEKGFTIYKCEGGIEFFTAGVNRSPFPISTKKHL